MALSESNGMRLHPLSSGGVLLEWHCRSQDLDIVIVAYGPVQFFYSNRAAGSAFEGTLSNPAAIAEFIRSLT